MKYSSSALEVRETVLGYLELSNNTFWKYNGGRSEYDVKQFRMFAYCRETAALILRHI